MSIQSYFDMDLPEPFTCYSQQPKPTNGDPPPTRPRPPLPPPQPRDGAKSPSQIFAVDGSSLANHNSRQLDHSSIDTSSDELRTLRVRDMVGTY